MSYLGARCPGKPWTEPEYDPLLAVHRIKKLEITERQFKSPKNYDFDKSFDKYFGIIKEDRFEVDIEFTGWAAGFIQEREWSKDQKIHELDNDTICVSFTAASAPEVISWVLFFGEEARVSKPDWFIKDIALSIDRMRINYKK